MNYLLPLLVGGPDMAKEKDLKIKTNNKYIISVSNNNLNS